jgi:ABC-type polysaccharide/polyol phosphate export permease
LQAAEQRMRDKLNLLFYFLKKDIKAKFAGSGLGLFWTILIPFVQILLFWFVFSAIMKTRPYANTQIPYIYFLLSSFFFWLAFSESVARSANVILENAEIVKKISFPVILLPVTAITSSYLLNSVGFLLFFIAYSIKTTPAPLMVFILPIVFFQFLFSLGIGMFLSALMPYVRDIGQILGYILQGIFFLSPIIYSLESIPEKMRIIFYLNPLTYFISSYHSIILQKQPPPVLYVLLLVLISTGSFFAGYFTFRKLRDGFADVL